jgi:hypothetical protein
LFYICSRHVNLSHLIVLLICVLFFFFFFHHYAGARGWFPASYVELLLPPKPGQNQLEQEVEVEVEIAGGDDGAQDGDEEEALEEIAEASSSLASTVVKPMAGYVAPKAAFASSGLYVSTKSLCRHVCIDVISSSWFLDFTLCCLLRLQWRFQGAGQSRRWYAASPFSGFLILRVACLDT